MTALLIAAAFALVENGRPAASFELADTNATFASSVSLMRMSAAFVL